MIRLWEETSVELFQGKRVSIGMRGTHSKCGAVGDADGKVGEYGKEAVGRWILEGQVMGDFMNSKEQILVRRCADDVSCEKERDGENWSGSKACCASDL